MSKQKRKEKKAEKEKKKAIKKATKKEPKIKKFMKKLKSKVKALGKDAPFAILLPFKGPMKKHLDKKNIPHTNSLRDIVFQFAKDVHKFNHFESQMLHAVHMDDAYHADEKKFDAEEKKMIASGLAGTGVAVAAGDYAGAIKTLVKVVIDFFKHVKAKKDRGEKLSSEEEQLLEDAEAVTEQIKESAIETGQETLAENIRDFIFSWKGGLAILALILLIVFAFK